MARRVLLSVFVIVVVGVVFGAVTMFGWMISETHFDRPDPGFDRLTAQIERTPGVSVDGQERWVEAPTFSDPTAWIHLTVDEARLPGLLSAACSSEYPGAIVWSIRVSTDSGSYVSLYTAPNPGRPAGGERCPDFGFDAVGAVREIGEAVPGVDMQAAVWDSGRFALLVLEEEDPVTLTDLLPLVDHAEDVRAAAGLDPRESVVIDSSALSAVIPFDEHDRYLALLTVLAEEHGVTSYWADGGGTPIDGVDKVQVTTPDREHAGITRAIRDSDLHVSDLPVRFRPPTP